jgi:aspartyl-tRNA(Asn)/glutamyl-tRNA(Gln) amidotransferase subunit A
MLDIAFLMRLLAGYDARDPGSALTPRPRYPRDVPEDLKGIRIGLPMSLSWAGVDSEISAVCSDALGVLVSRGATLVEIDPVARSGSPGRELIDIFDTINETEALRVHRHWLERSDLYTPQVRQRVLMGHRISARQYEDAVRRQLEWEHRWRDIFVDHHLSAIAHPTIDAPPPLLVPGMAPQGPQIGPSVPWSLAGFPVLSVPAGIDQRGLPVGLSLAAVPEREADLVGLGIVIDEEIGMWRRLPPAAITQTREVSEAPHA